MFKKRYTENDVLRSAELKSFNSVTKLAEQMTDINDLNYLIDMLKYDLCVSEAVKAMYNNGFSKPIESFIPTECYDTERNRIDIVADDEIDFKLVPEKTYVAPWDLRRSLKMYKKLSEAEFEYKADNHSSYYYDDIDICYVFCGNHSQHIGSLLRTGTVKSKLCQTRLLYDHIHTDGEKWYNSHTGEQIYSVYDFRAAAVYHLAQMRYNIFFSEMKEKLDK